MTSAPPNATITWLGLQSTFVNLTWQLFKGYVTVLQLRHANFTSNPLSGSLVSLHGSNIDISTWAVIKDDIGPHDTIVVAYPKGVNFNMDLYNVFAMIPFEDTQLHDGGVHTGSLSQLVVEPKSLGRKSFKIYFMCMPSSNFYILNTCCPYQCVFRMFTKVLVPGRSPA